MANPEHLKILKQGVEQWNEWRKKHRALELDLSEADLGRRELWASDLRGVDLSFANLRGCKFSGANLARAILRAADLRGADLNRAILAESDLSLAELVAADLIGADLRRANLAAADLRDADLARANLSEADLRQADLSGANLLGANLDETYLSQALAGTTSFAAVDLSTARGLEAIEHRSPSTVGIDTIYKSHGKIPEVFLRGCGVPEEFIDFIRQMGTRPIEFYSCFISYSTKDQEFAERLHADLQAKGVRCWFAPEEMKGGRKLHEQIDEAIRLHDKLLLILSEHSMNSNWVKSEIANAREREKREGKQLLFPITLVPFEAIKQWKLFDAEIGTDAAREIREYFIPDFSNWKDHDSYQTAFQRLVKDLKAGARG
jgi:hypothetical protein